MGRMGLHRQPEEADVVIDRMHIGRGSALAGVMLTALVAVTLPPAARGQGAAAAGPNATTDLNLRLGVGYSDNVNRSAADPLSSQFQFLGFRSNYFRNGNRLDLSLVSDVMVRDYEVETVPSEPVGSVNAGLTYDIVPNRVFWQLNDYYGQGTVNQFAASAVDTRQEINVISTGPRVQLPLGPRTNLTGGAAKSKNDFGGVGNLDFERTDYDLQLDRNLNPTTRLGIGANVRDLEFDIGGVGDSERTTVFLSYFRDLATGSFSVRGGRTSVEFAGAELDTPFMNITWARDVGARSRLTLGLNRDYADAADIFIRNTAFLNNGPSQGDVILDRNLIEFTRGQVNLAVTYPRTTWSFGSTIGELRYEQDPSLDNDELSLFAGVARQVRARLRASLFLRSYEREYLERGITNRDIDLRLSFTQQLGRRYFINGFLYRASRRGTAATFPYEESGIQLSLGIDLNP